MAKKTTKIKKKYKTSLATKPKEQSTISKLQKNPDKLNAFDKMLIWIVDWWKARKISTKISIIALLLLLFSFLWLLDNLNNDTVNINNYLYALTTGGAPDIKSVEPFLLSIFCVIVNSFVLIITMVWKLIVSFAKLLTPEYVTLADTFKEAKQVRLRL